MTEELCVCVSFCLNLDKMTKNTFQARLLNSTNLSKVNS